jgi:hypothetical protein
MTTGEITVTADGRHALLVRLREAYPYAPMRVIEDRVVWAETLLPTLDPARRAGTTIEDLVRMRLDARYLDPTRSAPIDLSDL